MLALVLEYRLAVYFCALLTTCALALWKGDGPERAIASVLISMIVIDGSYHAIFHIGINLASIDTAHALIDAGMLIAFLLIALKANRIYPLWIAALQLIAMNAHVAREMTSAMSTIVYMMMTVAPSYFQIILLALGLWLHRRRLTKFGPYKAWRSSLRPSQAKRPKL